MNIYKCTLIGVILQCTAVMCIAQENVWNGARPDGHAPISVMGDHYHSAGEIMFSYRYMSMSMDGNLLGSSDIGNDLIFSEYMIAPQTMQMDMHMIGVMYAPTDRITLMFMGNYLQNTMDLQTRAGLDFSTSSKGIGDASLSALVKLYRANRQSIHGTVGISIPTGSTDVRDDLPFGENLPLAYPMQLGSGTFDPLLGLTYLGQTNLISWGLQTQYRLRLGENSEEYTFGNVFGSTGWLAYKATNWLSISSSLTYTKAASIDGERTDLNKGAMPLFDAVNSGREQLDLGIGLNAFVPGGKAKNLRFGVEYKFPVMQEVDGTQMKNESMLILGLQYSL